MSSEIRIIENTEDLHDLTPALFDAAGAPPESVTALCGFDGFIDTFIRMRNPSSMAEFGPKVAAASGIAASYSVDHQGDKFGGNGPLFTSALYDLLSGQAEITYIGGIGRGEVDPLFAEVMRAKTSALYPLAPPAHSDCLEFTDGKIMLGDFDACAEITLDRLLEVVGETALDDLLDQVDVISAVNWGKLPQVGPIWSYMADRLRQRGRAEKEVLFFMDLAEFEHRDSGDVDELMASLPAITAQCNTILSFNLKEAWQMGDRLGGDFQGKKDPQDVAALAALLREHLDVDRIIIHPNSGAACASATEVVYVPGPYCQDPLISTGAGDNFGAGCVTAALAGLSDGAIVLAGNAASGYFVRSGRSASFGDLSALVRSWMAGSLPERL